MLCYKDCMVWIIRFGDNSGYRKAYFGDGERLYITSSAPDPEGDKRL